MATQKQVNAAGVTRIGTKIKSYVDSVKTTLESSLSSGLSAKQDALVSGESIKTINGETLLGSGDITIDLSLYKLVSSLPTSGIDADKIYLVASDTTGTSNVYTEYVYVNSAWEKLGEYKSDVDLTPYAKKTEAVKSITISGKTVTVTMADGTTTTLTTQDTTYTAATASAAGLMSAADKTKLDGIATGATKVTVDSALSSTSMNPVQNKAINTALAAKADASDTYTKSEVDAMVTASGTFSEADATKLAGIETGAEVNVIETVKVDGTALTVTEKAVDVPVATTSAAGVMSAADKTKLDGIATGANKTVVDTALNASSTNPLQNRAVYSALQDIDEKVSLKQDALTAGSNVTISSANVISAQDTHYESKNVVGSSATDGSDSTEAVANGSVRLNSVENGSVTSSHVIKGTGATTVKYDGSGSVVINSTNTTYSNASASAAGLMSSSDYSKLAAIDAGATADEALTDAEIDAALAEAGIE